MSIAAIARRANIGGRIGTANSCPIRNESSDNSIRVVPTGSGTTELSLAYTKTPLISGSGATVTLTVAQSGSVVLFDRAAGIVYTLPVPQVGLNYTFITTVTITSNNATVATDGASTFILGAVVNVKTDLTTLWALANGTSIVKIQSNGSTTGGILGAQYTLTAVSTTVWEITGYVLGSGTIATPFA